MRTGYAVLFLLASLAGCAGNGTRIQAECERSRAGIGDVVNCTKETLGRVAPAELQDAKAKLYILRGEQLAAEVAAGRTTEIEAKVAWQRLYVELWEPTVDESSARMRFMIDRLQQQQNQQSTDSGYKIVQPTRVPPTDSIFPLSIGVLATWTGKSHPGNSITGLTGVNCEYQYAGRRFWRMFQAICPPSVDAR